MASRSGSARVLSLREPSLAAIAGRVRAGEGRVRLEEGGETVAALVSASDLRALEALEDRLDLLDALDALAELRASGGTDFEQLKAERGI